MIVLLFFVFAVMLLAWLIAGLAFLAIVASALIWAVERMLGRPGRFLATDAEFLRSLGIRL